MFEYAEVVDFDTGKYIVIGKTETKNEALDAAVGHYRDTPMEKGMVVVFDRSLDELEQVVAVVAPDATGDVRIFSR